MKRLSKKIAAGAIGLGLAISGIGGSAHARELLPAKMLIPESDVKTWNEEDASSVKDWQKDLEDSSELKRLKAASWLTGWHTFKGEDEKIIGFLQSEDAAIKHGAALSIANQMEQDGNRDLKKHPEIEKALKKIMTEWAVNREATEGTRSPLPEASAALAHHYARTGNQPELVKLLTSKDTRVSVSAANALLMKETQVTKREIEPGVTISTHYTRAKYPLDERLNHLVVNGLINGIKAPRSSTLSYLEETERNEIRRTLLHEAEEGRDMSTVLPQLKQLPDSKDETKGFLYAAAVARGHENRGKWQEVAKGLISNTDAGVHHFILTRLLLATKNGEVGMRKAVPVLKDKLRKRNLDPNVADRINHVLAFYYAGQENWQEMKRHASRISERYIASTVADLREWRPNMPSMHTLELMDMAERAPKQPEVRYR